MDRYSQGTTDIEALKKILESLRITKEYASDKNRTIELVSSEEMLTASTIAVTHCETMAIAADCQCRSPGFSFLVERYLNAMPGIDVPRR